MMPQQPMTRNEWTEVKAKLMLLKQKVKDLLGMRNTFGDRIRIRDEIRFYWGSQEDIKLGKAKLFSATKGHIVNQALGHLVNILSCGTFYYSSGSGYWYSPSYGWAAKTTYMRVGTGGSVTTGASTTLTAQQDTAADGQSGSVSTPAGTLRLSWMATWNAGTLPAITITEVGLFLEIDSTLRAFGFATPDQTYSIPKLFSRLSEADGDFSSFAVNASVPLTIEWRLIFEFV